MTATNYVKSLCVYLIGRINEDHDSHYYRFNSRRGTLSLSFALASMELLEIRLYGEKKETIFSTTCGVKHDPETGKFSYACCKHYFVALPSPPDMNQRVGSGIELARRRTEEYQHLMQKEAKLLVEDIVE
jgi:hypothetical protein